jgi:hypothetical protein
MRAARRCRSWDWSRSPRGPFPCRLRQACILSRERARVNEVGRLSTSEASRTGPPRSQARSGRHGRVPARIDLARPGDARATHPGGSPGRREPGREGWNSARSAWSSVQPSRHPRLLKIAQKASPASVY